jgi:hypothetical protein
MRKLWTLQTEDDCWPSRLSSNFCLLLQLVLVPLTILLFVLVAAGLFVLTEY